MSENLTHATLHAHIALIHPYLDIEHFLIFQAILPGRFYDSHNNRLLYPL